jgi:inositol hexakisphosphate/diphosphoinositol-pentakisphosphate kinase
MNFRSGRESDSDAEVEHAEKLRQVRAVLEEVTQFIKYLWGLIE